MHKPWYLQMSMVLRGILKKGHVQKNSHLPQKQGNKSCFAAHRIKLKLQLTLHLITVQLNDIHLFNSMSLLNTAAHDDSNRYGNSRQHTPRPLLLRQTKRYHSRRWLVELINRLTPNTLPLADRPVNHVCRKKKKVLLRLRLSIVTERGEKAEKERGIRHKTEWCDKTVSCGWFRVYLSRYGGTTAFCFGLGLILVWMGILPQASDIWFIFIIWFIYCFCLCIREMKRVNSFQRWAS